MILFHIFLFSFFNLYLLHKMPPVNTFIKKNPIFFIKAIEKIDQILETVGNATLQDKKTALYKDINELENEKKSLEKQIEAIDKRFNKQQEKIDVLQQAIDQKKLSLKNINNQTQNESKNDKQKKITEPTKHSNTEEQHPTSLIEKKLAKNKKKLKKIKKQLQIKEKTNQYILIIITISLTFIVSIFLLIFFNKIKILGYEKN
ncbi:hypothetical protein ATP_00148 [Candidatus Phytoplasma mali]|uniref:Transmembrane protein n=1 Tax=Phytoplasma mali (strain AT) TaxID=482235 RepID=B3R0H1_PHYMT|nr:hypothetical protein [Candidatus Phytoplasma mali]CAP18335.1 hypothetical protein ATP_00148 [Candidatus Phytoplasma mali]